MNIDGIGDTQIKSIKNFFQNKTNVKVLNELNNVLKIKNTSEQKKTGSLKEKTFMITGKLTGMSRAEAKSLIEQNSGIIVSSVTKKLNFLVVGEKPTKNKIDTADKLNTKIISQKDLVKMLEN